jgi:hypothetical protein
MWRLKELGVNFLNGFSIKRKTLRMNGGFWSVLLRIAGNAGRNIQ